MERDENTPPLIKKVLQLDFKLKRLRPEALGSHPICDSDCIVFHSDNMVILNIIDVAL
jgi:hypothetical protein